MKRNKFQADASAEIELVRPISYRYMHIYNNSNKMKFKADKSSVKIATSDLALTMNCFSRRLLVNVSGF